MKPATNFTIIYDDYATGVRAKHFADKLAATMREPDYTVSPWRCEMLDWDELAADAMRDAAASEYVIFSLRGDNDLSSAVKQWIEAWVECARGGSAIVIALFDPERCTLGHASGTRHYLRHVAEEAGVDFFCHCAVATEAAGTLPGRKHGSFAGALPALLLPGLAAA